MASNQQQASSSGSCGACQKEGDVFILPLRYAALSRLTGLPRLPLPVGAGKGVKPISLTSADYTVQILRKGYLYLLEQRSDGDHWRGFTVSEHGTLTEGTAQMLPKIIDNFTCDVNTHGVMASCINFERSDDISQVYLLFTPHRLTPARLDYFAGEGRHLLQSMTMTELKAGQHAAVDNGLEVIAPAQLEQCVLEFKLAQMFKARSDRGEMAQYGYRQDDPRFKSIPNPGRYISFMDDMVGNPVQVGTDKQLDCLNTPYRDLPFRVPAFHSGVYRYPRLVELLTQRQGVGVVVNDAIGITQSLNNSRNRAIEVAMKGWFEHQDGQGFSNEDKYIIYKKIMELKEGYGQLIASADLTTALRRSAHYHEMEQVDWTADEIDRYSESAYQARVEMVKREQETQYGTVAKQQALQDEFNNQYWSRLGNVPDGKGGFTSQKLIEQFGEEFNRLSEQAQANAESTSRDIAGWLGSLALVNHFSAYDPDTVEQGIFFASQVGLCLYGVASSPVLAALLDQWWDERAVSERNLCWRAYCFNQTKAKTWVNGYLTEFAQSAQSTQWENALTQLTGQGRVDVAKVDVGEILSAFIEKTSEFAGFYDDVSSMVAAMEATGEAPPLISSVFADLGRRLLKGYGASQLDKGVHYCLSGMVVAGIGLKSEQRALLKQLSAGASPEKIHSKIMQAGNKGRTLAEKNLAKALYEQPKGDFYKVRLTGGMAVLESLILLARIRGLQDKQDSQAYLNAVASVLTLSSAAFTLYASFAELAINARSGSTMRDVVPMYTGKFAFWGGSLAFLAGGALSTVDFIEAAAQAEKGNTMIADAYRVRGLAVMGFSVMRFTITLDASSAWLNSVARRYGGKGKAGWFMTRLAGLSGSKLVQLGAVRFLMLCPYVNAGIMVISIVIWMLEPNALEEWFEKSSFGQGKERYKDVTEEMTALVQGIEGVI